MSTREFQYELPAELIAQAPLAVRTDSRLLHVTGPLGNYQDLRFLDLSDLIEPGDLLVLNDTRVLPARLFGRKSSGGKLELLLERQLGADRALVQLKASRSPAVGSELEFEGGVKAILEGRQDEFFILRFAAPVAEIFARYGHTPLPPYIRRAVDPVDRERYQSVFARKPGAVAAPTAGLHFDHGQLNRLRSRGVEVAFLTLHVGAGTFQPLRAAQLEAQQLHAEHLEISESLCEAVAAARERGGRIIAVGTTTLRGLESAAQSEAGRVELRPFHGDTQLFILPGYKFKLVDSLLTNFHLPESSLLMLVCAFAGSAATLDAYAYAVQRGYRFYSYGDAMFCHQQNGSRRPQTGFGK
jgi:S-adenosylmethionine:tRNA ribosyltransferase-isomerase